MGNLIRIVSNRENPVHMMNINSNLDITLCPNCKKIKRSIYPKPIDVYLVNNPDLRITGGLWWTGIRIFHRKFIEQIQDYLTGFTLGKCFDNTGKLIEDYLTCYSKNYIVIRGQPKSRYDICPLCKTVGPIPGIFPHYIPRFYLTDSLVYQNSYCSMFLAEELIEKIDFSYWRDVEFDKVPIIDDVIDGVHLPIDPPIIK